jgi:hypothetical protein
VRFLGCDNESLAPIFTPPRSVAEAEVDASLPQQAYEDVHVHTYTAEETKEVFLMLLVTAWNFFQLFSLLPLSRMLCR